MGVKLVASSGGSVELVPTNTASNFTVTVPAGTGTVAVQGVSTNIVSGTAVASTSGTSIDFTGIPSWVKRVTVMFNGVSTNGTSVPQVQLGTSGGVVTTGYIDAVTVVSTSVNNTTRGATFTSGFAFAHQESASDTWYGSYIFSLLGSNTWVLSGAIYSVGGGQITTGAGSIALSGTLDRVRITTVNGTDTFDAGSINILYE